MIRKALMAIAAAATLATGVLATTSAAEAHHRHHSNVHVGIFVGSGYGGLGDFDGYDGFGYHRRHYGRFMHTRGHCHLVRVGRRHHRHLARVCHRHWHDHFWHH